MVYGSVMGRTNIDIDDELIERVMRRYRLPSKRAAVDLALRRLAGEPMSRDEALSMEGTGWSGDLDAMREPDATAWPGDASAGS
jgi:Arc/MetJ family transcription regulator